MTVEQRLCEAFFARRGIRLSAEEVEALIGLDDAIQTRIVNVAIEKRGDVPFGNTDRRFGTIPYSQLGE